MASHSLLKEPALVRKRLCFHTKKQTRFSLLFRLAATEMVRRLNPPRDS